MDPCLRSKHAHRPARVAALGLVSAALLLAVPAGAQQAEKITICHATGSATNPFVNETIAAQAVVAAHIEHQHGEDIIPEFTHDGVTYSQNLDADGLALLANGCVAPTTSPSPTSTASPSSTASVTSTASASSTTDGNTTEVPFFTSGTALVLGLGGALAGTFAMLRRRI